MLLRLDFSGDVPIYQQIRNQVVIAIASGDLRPGEKLPTVRALAEEAGINMMTASKFHANVDRQIKNSTAYTMATIFNCITESESDLMLDPYLNSLGSPPGR